MAQLSETQQKVIDCLTAAPECSKQKLYDHCAVNYYSNGMFHFGNILSNMVKKGLIERVHKGVYAIKPKPKPMNNRDLMNSFFDNIK